MDCMTYAEFIKGRLYFGSVKGGAPRSTEQTYYFCTDNTLAYEPFFKDFGPLSLGQIYRFCAFVKKALEDPKLEGKRIAYISDTLPNKRANAAVNIGVFAIFHLGMTPEEAYKPLSHLKPTFHPFRDAGYGPNVYQITVYDVLRGVFRGKEEGWLNFDTFDLQEYEHFERVENGDLNWHIPGKFLAFSGPSARRQMIQGYQMLTPEDYVPYFKKKHVTCVVRLNKKIYDKRQFTDHGIRHVDLYFIDGGVPPPEILKKFLELAETEKGALAVHCKAGLGRTGVLIGAYIMKHYHWTANEVMGYMRVCRPGSVLGPQQNYLKDNEKALWKMGELYRKKKETESLVESPSSSSRSHNAIAADVLSPQLRTPTNYQPTSRPGAGSPGSPGSPASPSKIKHDALFEIRALSIDPHGSVSTSPSPSRLESRNGAVAPSTFQRSRFSTGARKSGAAIAVGSRTAIRTTNVARYPPGMAQKTVRPVVITLLIPICECVDEAQDVL